MVVRLHAAEALGKIGGMQTIAPLERALLEDEEEDVRRCLAMGAVDYITKPFDIEVLQDRISTHLQNASRK